MSQSAHTSHTNSILRPSVRQVDTEQKSTSMTDGYRTFCWQACDLIRGETHQIRFPARSSKLENNASRFARSLLVEGRVRPGTYITHYLLSPRSASVAQTVEDSRALIDIS